MAFLYRVQQRLLAADVELPTLEAAPPGGVPDITITITTPRRNPVGFAEPWYVNEESGLAIDRAGDGFVLRFTDATSFFVTRDRIELLAAPSAYTTGDLAAYVLAPVLGVVLHLRGAVLLHASCVEIGGRAILFAGESGQGKSTTAAILQRQGFRVLSDDLTEIDGVCAIPSMPSIRLWPEMVEALYGPAASFPDRAPSWDKKVVALDDRTFLGAPREIAAVLFLHRGRGAALTPLAPKAAWTQLMTNGYTVRLPDEAMSRRIFDVLGDLAHRVRAFDFAAPPLEHSEGLGAFLARELGL